METKVEVFPHVLQVSVRMEPEDQPLCISLDPETASKLYLQLGAGLEQQITNRRNEVTALPLVNYYKNKQVQVAAAHFTTNNEAGSPQMDQIVEWINSNHHTKLSRHDGTSIYIGGLIADVGDYIIQDESGVFQVLNKEEFEEQYQINRGSLTLPIDPPVTPPTTEELLQAMGAYKPQMLPQSSSEPDLQVNSQAKTPPEQDQRLQEIISMLKTPSTIPSKEDVEAALKYSERGDIFIRVPASWLEKYGLLIPVETSHFKFQTYRCNLPSQVAAVCLTTDPKQLNYVAHRINQICAEPIARRDETNLYFKRDQHEIKIDQGSYILVELKYKAFIFIMSANTFNCSYTLDQDQQPSITQPENEPSPSSGC